MAAKRKPSASALRKRRVRRVAALRAQGLTSAQIGKRLGLAPSTVRDYWNDPLRRRARARQARWAVTGVAGITSVKKEWRKGAPHPGKGAPHAAARGRQMRAVIGSYAKRGRR